MFFFLYLKNNSLTIFSEVASFAYASCNILIFIEKKNVLPLKSL